MVRRIGIDPACRHTGGAVDPTRSETGHRAGTVRHIRTRGSILYRGDWIIEFLKADGGRHGQ
jgi:hypothetical protein